MCPSTGPFHHVGANAQTAAMAAVMLVGLAVTVPLFTSGYDYSIVLTASMEPRIAVGDVVAIQPAEPDEIEVGQVMAFHAPDKSVNKPVIHRVVEIEENADGERQFHTKGDNLEERDPWVVQEEHVIGTIAYQIPKVGWAINAFQSGNRILYLLMIVGPAAALVYDEVRKLTGEEEEREPSGGASWLTPYAHRLHERFSQVDEEGVEQSAIAWMASRYLPEDDEEPFIVVD